MAAGGLLVFESTHHLTEGVLKEVWQANETLVQQDRVDTAIANPTKQKKAKEGYPKLRYGVDVVKAGIGSYLTNIGFDRINSLAAK